MPRRSSPSHITGSSSCGVLRRRISPAWSRPWTRHVTPLLFFSVFFSFPLFFIVFYLTPVKSNSPNAVSIAFSEIHVIIIVLISHRYFYSRNTFPAVFFWQKKSDLFGSILASLHVLLSVQKTNRFDTPRISNRGRKQSAIFSSSSSCTISSQVNLRHCDVLIQMHLETAFFCFGKGEGRVWRFRMLPFL